MNRILKPPPWDRLRLNAKQTLLTPELLQKLPPYDLDNPIPPEKKVIHLHLFAEDFDLWVAEFDPVDGVFFGTVSYNGGRSKEWGSLGILEILNYRSQPSRRALERDEFWIPRPFGDA